MMLSILRIASDGFRGLSACLIFIILTSVLFTGCMTAAHRKAMSIRQGIGTLHQNTKLCHQNIKDNPAYQSVFSHMPLSSDPTLTQLTDVAKPTAEDVKILMAIYNDNSQCRAQIIEGYATYAPSIVPILVENYHARDLITAELVEGKITWGEANKRQLAQKDAFDKKFREETSRIAQEIQMSHEAEISNRQAVGLAVTDSLTEWGKQQQALADRLQNQQLINSLNRPKSTNCQVFGNMVNCTTY